MKRFNCATIRFIFIGIVAGIVFGGGRAKADFTFGEPTSLGSPVNTEAANECFSAISSDGLELYIWDPYGPIPGGLGGWDLWITSRQSPSEPWGSPVNLGPPINSSSDDVKASISADGLSLYFGSNRPGGYGGYDLWMSTRATVTDDWGDPVNLGESVNSEADEAFPYISKDGLELYFSGFLSPRPGGYGDPDIWVAKRATTDDLWGEPVNLGEAINTSYYDVCPYLSPDGRLLFFHSLRPGGPGFENMLMSTRPTTSDAWSPAVFLPTPINSTADEGGTGISDDGLTFYFSSDRDNSDLYLYDIWQAPIMPIVDLNGDGIVDADDMVIMVDHWGTDDSLCDIGPMPWGDGVVDVQDLIVLAEHLFEEVPLTQ